MKKITLILILISCFLAKAQNAQNIIDGLKNDLKSNPDNKKRATIYSDLTWYYANISTDSALVYGEKAITVSTKLKDSVLIAQVYSDLGAVYFRRSDYSLSKINYLKARSLRIKLKDFNGVNKVNSNLSTIYINTQDYKSAMNIGLESLKYFESQNDINNAMVVKSNLGDLFIKLKNYPKAINYLTESINYHKNIKNNERLCENYLNIVNAYRLNKDTLKAFSNYEIGLRYCKLVGNSKAISILKQNAGILMSKQKKYKEALKLFLESKKIANSSGSEIDKANIKISLVRNLIIQKKFQEAFNTLAEIKKTYIKANLKNELINVYKFLIPVHSNLGNNDSVVYYSERYIKLYEENIKFEIIKQTAELETKYQTAKKEKQILQQQAEAQQKNLYILGISVFAVLVGLIGFLIYRQQKLKNKQQSQEFDLKSAIVQIESQNKLQEQRLSISRDLHDNIGAQLTFIISSVDNVKYGFNIDNPKLDKKLTNISSFAKDTILELRDTIWAMNSNEISYEDLEVRINNFIDKAKTSQEKISFSFAIAESLKTQKLNSIQGMNLYRTIQEAVNNTLKYANANVVSINVKQVDNQTKITISDNGNGFDMATIEKGNGLNNMKKRIEEIGGKFDLNSGKDGTRIEILINS